MFIAETMCKIPWYQSQINKSPKLAPISYNLRSLSHQTNDGQKKCPTVIPFRTLASPLVLSFETARIWCPTFGWTQKKYNDQLYVFVCVWECHMVFLAIVAKFNDDELHIIYVLRICACTKFSDIVLHVNTHFTVLVSRILVFGIYTRKTRLGLGRTRWMNM